MKKNNFKKITLVVVSAVSSIGSYMWSGAGIAAATLGSLTAVTVFAVEKKKTSKHDKKTTEKMDKKEANKSKKTTTDKIAQKKDLRKKITNKKKDLKEHKNEQKKLKRSGKGATPEAQRHATIIEDLEQDIKMMKKDLRDL